MNDKPAIDAIVKHYGGQLPYGRSGWVKMKCPFHGDTHASAAINVQENAYKCFACDVQGDAYDIIMHEEGVNFVKAKQLAERISPTSGEDVRSGRGSSRGLSKKSRTNIGRRGSVLDRGSE